MLTIRVKNYPDVARTTFIVRDERTREKNHYVIAVDLTMNAEPILRALLDVMGRDDTVEIITFGSHTRSRICSKCDPFIFEMLKRTETSCNPMVALSCKASPILISDGVFTEGPTVDFVSKLTSNVLCLSSVPSENMGKMASLTKGMHYVTNGTHAETKKKLRHLLKLGQPETFNIKVEGNFGSIDISPISAGESVEINAFTPESGTATLVYMDKNGLTFRDEIPFTPEELHHMKECSMKE